MNGEMKVTALDMAQVALNTAVAQRDEALGKIAILEADLKGCRQSRGTAKERVAILEGDRTRDKAEIVKLDRDVAIARDQRDHAEKERDAATSNRLREALAMVDALNAQNKELQKDSIALGVANEQIGYLRDDVAKMNELKRKLAIAEQDVARMRVERESEMDATRDDNARLQQLVNQLRIDAKDLSAGWRAADADLKIARADERKLRDELAVILRERNDAHLALAEARANLRLAAMRIEGFIAAKDDALAEIDGLRAQLSTQADEMIRFTNLANDYATVSQKLAGCESALRLSLAGTEQHYFASPARIDDVRAALAERTRERDEARAEAEEAAQAAWFKDELVAKR